MRILLVNDDGVLSPGLSALRSAVADMGEITVVAPDSPQSAAGRSITLHEPLICNRIIIDGQFEAISVSGRPVDCVKLAIRELMDKPPDLVLSGINAGENVGINIFYSGTVSAAAEGAVMGVPAVAFSLAGDVERMDFHQAARLCRKILDRILEIGILTAGGGSGGSELINVNIPDLSSHPPRGVKVVPQSTAAIAEQYIRQEDEQNRMVYTLAEHYEHAPHQADTDVTALYDGYITITPLMSDMTDYKRLDHLRQWKWGELDLTP